MSGVLHRVGALLPEEVALVDRLRDRAAAAFSLPRSFPFFHHDHIPGESADEALLRLYRGEQAARLERGWPATEEDVFDSLIYG